MSASVGIDLGGTKIEAQIFDENWQRVDSRRIDTPKDYDALVSAVAAQISWAEDLAGQRAPVGIAAAGLISTQTGLALTANLPATGKPFPADIEKAAARSVTYVNDCRALTLSEAKFGAAQGASPVVGLILGTGVGGGLAIDGKLVDGPTGLSGEFGHMPLPGYLAKAHGLPILTCGCGRQGCVETFIAGPGLSRLVGMKTGMEMDAVEIAKLRKFDPEVADAFNVWLQLVAGLLDMLVLASDPAIIVIGGGLSKIDGLADDLTAELTKMRWDGFSGGRICIAQGGDTSGARGAAYAAYCEASNG